MEHIITPKVRFKPLTAARRPSGVSVHTVSDSSAANCSLATVRGREGERERRREIEGGRKETEGENREVEGERDREGDRGREIQGGR